MQLVATYPNYYSYLEDLLSFNKAFTQVIQQITSDANSAEYDQLESFLSSKKNTNKLLAASIKTLNTYAIQFCLNNSANITTHYQGLTALHYAVKYNDIKLLNVILDPAIISKNIDMQDLAGSTALHYAVNQDNLDAVKLLLSAGANSQIEDYNNCSPLDYALKRNNPQILELMQSYKAKNQLT